MTVRTINEARGTTKGELIERCRAESKGKGKCAGERMHFFFVGHGSFKHVDAQKCIIFLLFRLIFCRWDL